MSRGNGNLVPMIVIGIIVFISYQSNPEYWKKGKLFTDMKTTSSSTMVETKDVANIPAQTPPPPAAKPYTGNQSGSAEDNRQPSIRGARVIPKEVLVGNQNDAMYPIRNATTKVIYYSYPKTDLSKAHQYNGEIHSAIEQAGLKSTFIVIHNFYVPVGANSEIGPGGTPGEEFLNKNCTKNVCIINPSKKEIVFVSKNTGAVAAKAKELRNW